MKLTRRDFIRATSALAAAFGLRSTGLLGSGEALAREADDGGVPVVWLQGQSCSGCSVSLLNSIYYMPVDDVLVNVLDLDFHPTVMAAAGHLAVSAAEKAYRHGEYVLVVEGSIPTAANGAYCHMWAGMPAVKAVDRYAKRASVIMAVGACACYGGMIKGAPNPTGAQGLEAEYYGKPVVKIPGCPSHPRWVVGTVASILATGTIPALDADGRPLDFFGTKIHARCTLKESHDNDEFAPSLSEYGCLFNLGCKGKETFADCPELQWNSGGPDEPGVNWCVGSGSPCIGCTEPDFPDGKSPFFTLDPQKRRTPVRDR